MRTECDGAGVIIWSRHTIVAALTVKGGSMLKFILGVIVGLGFVLFEEYVMPVLQRVVGCIQ